MPYALQQFFLNGGSEAVVVRVAHLTGAGTVARIGKLTVGGTTNPLHLEAASPGSWSQNLLVRIDHQTSDPTSRFNLSIKDTGTGQVEVLRNLAPDASLGPIVSGQSRLVKAVSPFPAGLPDKNADISPGDDPFDPAHTNRYTAFSTGTGGVIAIPDHDLGE